MLYTEGKWREGPPRQRDTLRWVSVLKIASNGMYIFQATNSNQPVWFMDLDTNNNITKYERNLEQGILKSVIFKRVDMSLLFLEFF